MRKGFSKDGMLVLMDIGMLAVGPGWDCTGGIHPAAWSAFRTLQSSGLQIHHFVGSFLCCLNGGRDESSNVDGMCPGAGSSEGRRGPCLHEREQSYGKINGRLTSAV